MGRGSGSLLRHLTPPALIRVFPENKAGGQSGRGRAQAAGPRVPKQFSATGRPGPRQDPLSLFLGAPQFFSLNKPSGPQVAKNEHLKEGLGVWTDKKPSPDGRRPGDQVYRGI